MKLTLHHINVCADDMKELTEFYSNTLGLDTLPMPPMIARSDSGESHPDDEGEWEEGVRFYDAGDPSQLQLHASRRQPALAAERGQPINPLATGHFAFRTDDIAAVRKRLTELGVPFADYGEWAVQGWDQIFLTDPAGNVIEIHQVAQ